MKTRASRPRPRAISGLDAPPKQPAQQTSTFVIPRARPVRDDTLVLPESGPVAIGAGASRAIDLDEATLKVSGAPSLLRRHALLLSGALVIMGASWWIILGEPSPPVPAPVVHARAVAAVVTLPAPSPVSPIASAPLTHTVVDVDADDAPAPAPTHDKHQKKHVVPRTRTAAAKVAMRGGPS